MATVAGMLGVPLVLAVTAGCAVCSFSGQPGVAGALGGTAAGAADLIAATGLRLSVVLRVATGCILVGRGHRSWPAQPSHPAFTRA